MKILACYVLVRYAKYYHQKHRYFAKKDVLENFSKFTGKALICRPRASLKRDSGDWILNSHLKPFHLPVVLFLHSRLFLVPSILWTNRSFVLSNTFNPLNANPTKWSNTLKQFVGNLGTNCLSVFDHFVNLALKGLKRIKQANKRLLKRKQRQQLYGVLKNNSSVIRQKSESQNGGNKKTKHVTFSEKQIFLTPWYAHFITDELL